MLRFRSIFAIRTAVAIEFNFDCDVSARDVNTIGALAPITTPAKLPPVR